MVLVQIGTVLEADAKTRSAHQIECGFSKADIETITNGKCPEGFSDKQKMAYRVASELGNPGSLPQTTYDESIKVSPAGLAHENVKMLTRERCLDRMGRMG